MCLTVCSLRFVVVAVYQLLTGLNITRGVFARLLEGQHGAGLDTNMLLASACRVCEDVICAWTVTRCPSHNQEGLVLGLPAGTCCTYATWGLDGRGGSISTRRLNNVCSSCALQYIEQTISEWYIYTMSKLLDHLSFHHQHQHH